MRIVVAWLLFLRMVIGVAAQADTLRVYLSGRGNDDAVPWRFMCTAGAQSGFWTNIPVPSNWELHGFGTLSYKKDPTNAWSEQGIYEREFYLAPDLQGHRVFIVFEGVMTDTEVFVNGQSAGPKHQGGFYRFKYEITRLVNWGRSNLLRVVVSKHSSNESVNRAERLADYWVFGGIYRPVYLELVPPQFIERVAIDARHDGTFRMDVFTSGLTRADENMWIEAEVTDVAGRLIGPPVRTPIGPENTATITARFENVRPWSAETPNLYRVVAKLCHNSQGLHRYTQRFGFRTIEVRPADGIYLNGRRIVLKGVNRHSFWPDSGRCLSEAIHRLDITLIKQMNMNAVRMSHYPPDAEFLDLCDELGLYVLDELAGWHNAYDSTVGAQLVRAMVTRDVNHPCVLFWNNGNEGGWNPALDHEFAKYDPQGRLVLHPWCPFNGINTAHYLAYDTAAVACTGKPMYYRQGTESVDPNDTNTYIYMPTEFLHAMYDGGGGAGLEDYWALMQASPVLGGGFIWAFIDEAVRRPDTGQLDTAGNQAPDGVLGPYREKEASFFAIKEIWSPIQARFEAPDRIWIQNQYSFTDGAECTFHWRLLKFPLPDGGRAAATTVLGEGKLQVSSLPPGQTATVRIELPRALRASADALALEVRDPSGETLWTWVWPITPADSAFEHVLAQLTPRSKGASRSPVLRETGAELEIDAGGLTFVFSKTNGYLASVRVGRRLIPFGNGPRPASGHAVLRSVTTSQAGRTVEVIASYDGDLTRAHWRIFPSGWARCDFEYRAEGARPCFGVVFDYPETRVQGKRWVGDGPYRVWKNRLRGVTLGYWTNAYNDTVTGHCGWNYPEFKGCFSNVRWLELETADGSITIVPAGVPFVQVLTPRQPPESLAGHARAELPECGLGLLHAIPPIGSKFKPPETTGPQGQSNIGTGHYKGSVIIRIVPAR